MGIRHHGDERVSGDLQEMTFLAGILTIRDAIKGGFVFVEGILSVLPICDKIYINDAGSTDGTLEALQRMKETWPSKIELLQIPDTDFESTHFQLVDDVINQKILPIVDSEWVLSLEGDTVWHESTIFDLLNLMKNTKCNSIRQPGWDTQWCTKNAYKDFKSVRIARNLPGLQMTDGGGGFMIGARFDGGGHGMSGVAPEALVDYPRFHFPYLFPGNAIERARRHAEHLETSNEGRKKQYEDLKERFKDLTFSKQTICPSGGLPALVKGLAGEPVYYVRDELFDLEWLKETTGMDYDLC
jgi:hypothetical protein